jgi:succinyl-diaminopimelate desuccinylase
LFAKLGSRKPHFCFAGHTDVVPPGGRWTTDPFQGVIKEGFLYGRGAVDMKGAIGAFVAAVARTLAKDPLSCSVSLLITADEEGVAINGTQKVLTWLKERGEKIDFCLVGEPICQERLGDTLKIGRRGSLNTLLTVKGVQGHVAYPERSSNPLPRLIDVLYHLKNDPQEPKSSYFDPSHLEVTSIDVGNDVTNVIPACAIARFNIRFSDQQTGASLQEWIRKICQQYAGDHEISFQLSGEADCMFPNDATVLIGEVIQKMTGLIPDLNTRGGTSDARFIRHDAPVVEFGLVGRTMHQVDECVSLKDLESLTEIYQEILAQAHRL